MFERKEEVNKMKKLLGVFLCCGLLLSGCGANGSDDADKGKKEEVNLIAGGSTSIQPLMEELAAVFEEEGLGTVDVQGGGSSVGTKGATDGTFNVGMVSRNLKEEEAKELDALTIALDGIVIIVNNDNKVKDLSLEDAKKIYTGEITNWSELGGEDAPIAVVAREEGSGTRDGFESIVGFESEEMIADANIQNATGGVVTQVNTNKNAIGYISFGSLTDEVRAATIDGVACSDEAIADGSYKLQRPFVLAVKKGNKDADALLDFIFSKKGQAVITENKYVPQERK